MSPLRLLFLALAIWGAIHPYYYFLSYMSETGTGITGLMEAWWVNDSTSGLVWDLTIATIALTVWVLVESFQRKDWLGLIAIPANYFIGLSCALPLYLFLRSRDRG